MHAYILLTIMMLMHDLIVESWTTLALIIYLCCQDVSIWIFHALARIYLHTPYTFYPFLQAGKLLLACVAKKMCIIP